MTDATVQKIRAFNRFYMPRMNLLGNHYLGSEYSATEARVLFEVLQNDGCTATSIARAMNIDKGYLSRIISAHEKAGYLRRTVSSGDGRARSLHLTETGRARAQEFVDLSNEEVADILAPLSPAERKRLEDALDTVTELLSKGEQQA